MTFKKQIMLPLFVVIGAFLIDGLFHLFYTTPFETQTYFGIKVFLVFTFSFLLFSMKSTLVRTVFFSGLFALSFSIYYRLFELLFGLPWGARVPDIVFQSATITYQADPWLSAIIWAIVHFSAFFIPAFVVGKVSSSTI